MANSKPGKKSKAKVKKLNKFDLLLKGKRKRNECWTLRCKNKRKTIDPFCIECRAELSLPSPNTSEIYTTSNPKIYKLVY
jgi:hypothetical protein